jgi:phage terminase large subunit
VTSPRGFNWIYDVFAEGNRNGYKMYHAASYENPFLPIETLQAMYANYSPELFKQEVEGLFVQFEGAVFPTFDPKMHVGDYPYIPGRPVWLTVDFGFTNPYAVEVLQIDANGRIFVIDEEYRTKCTDEEITALMRAKPYWSQVRGATADSSEPDRIERLRKMGWPIEPAKKVGIPAGIESLRGVLEFDPILQSPLLVVDKSCESLINEFKLYTYPESRDHRNDREIPVDRYNHGISAIIYYITTFWSRMAGIERPSGPMQRKIMAFQSIGNRNSPSHTLIAREKLAKIR